jgi:hypothetical protein
MTRLNFVFVLSFFAVAMETVLGTYGVWFPVCAYWIFYLAVTAGWRTTLCTAILCGFVVDLLFRRSIPISPLLLCACMGLAIFWLHRIESASIIMHAIPGMLLPAICLVPFGILTSLFRAGDADPLFVWGAILLFSMMCGAVLLPLGIIALDSLANGLELPLYADAREKIADRSAEQ